MKKHLELSNFLFAENVFEFVCFLWEYLNFTKNSSYMLGICQKHEMFWELDLKNFFMSNIERNMTYFFNLNRHPIEKKVILI